MSRCLGSSISDEFANGCAGSYSAKDWTMGQNQRDSQSPVTSGTNSTASVAGAADAGAQAVPESGARKVQLKRDLRGMSFADGQSQLQFKEAGSPTADPASMAQVAESGFAGPKRAVPQKERVEATLGADLSAVSAYTGPTAKAACEQLGAEAFTLGPKMAFRDEQPALSTILHESTHAIQQGAADGSTATSVGAGSSDGDMEAEANAAEGAAGKAGTLSVKGGATKRVARKVQRKGDPTTALDVPPSPDKKAEKTPDPYQELKKLVQSTRAQQIGSIKKIVGWHYHQRQRRRENSANLRALGWSDHRGHDAGFASLHDEGFHRQLELPACGSLAKRSVGILFCCVSGPVWGFGHRRFDRHESEWSACAATIAGCVCTSEPANKEDRENTGLGQWTSRAHDHDHGQRIFEGRLRS